MSAAKDGTGRRKGLCVRLARLAGLLDSEEQAYSDACDHGPKGPSLDTFGHERNVWCKEVRESLFPGFSQRSRAHQIL
jgi:hypothetical protein